MKRYQAYIIAIVPVFYTLHFCFTANIKAQIKKIKAANIKARNDCSHYISEKTPTQLFNSCSVKSLMLLSYLNSSRNELPSEYQ